MRRLTSSLGIGLLALLLSGWGGALAAAFCPHGGGGEKLSLVEDHSCCRANQASGHHSGSHQAMHGMKAEAASGTRNDQRRAPAVGQLNGTCAHCVGRQNGPVASAGPREVTLKKRGVSAPARQVATGIRPHTPDFAAHPAARQNAPPGLSNRRHLILLNTFLI